MRKRFLLFVISFLSLLTLDAASSILTLYDKFDYLTLVNFGYQNFFSSHPICRTTLIRENKQDSYDLIGFYIDPGKEKIIYGDVGKKINSWSKIYNLSGLSVKYPQSSTIDNSGNFYLVDTGNNRVLLFKYDFEKRTLEYNKIFISDLNEPSDIAINTNYTPSTNDDRIWIAEFGNNRIIECDYNGKIIHQYCSLGSGEFQLNHPNSLCIYKSFPNNLTYLLISDSGNNRMVAMGTDSSWYDYTFNENINIQGIDVMDEEIYLIDYGESAIYKMKWPNLFLTKFTGSSEAIITNPICISTPKEQMYPYLAISEEVSKNSGLKLYTQGVEIANFKTEYINNYLVYSYCLPTNAIVTEEILDENHNIIKTLKKDILLKSSPLVDGYWDLTDDNNNNVQNGHYFLRCEVKTAWKWQDTNDFGDCVTENFDIDLNQIITKCTEEIPKSFNFHQNYPNPFNASTTLLYELPVNCDVTITIYDIMGREVQKYSEIEKSAGIHKLIWNGDNLYGNKVASGVYFVKFKAQNYQKIKKLIIIK